MNAPPSDNPSFQWSAHPLKVPPPKDSTSGDNDLQIEIVKWPKAVQGPLLDSTLNEALGNSLSSGGASQQLDSL